MTKENWKKELAELMKEEELPNGDWNMIDGYIPLEDFISTLLALQKKELLEKIKLEKKKIPWKAKNYIVKDIQIEWGYNEAVNDLEDIKKLLT